MKKLLSLLLLLLSVSLASSAGVVIGIGPSSFLAPCATGFTCDANGWTVFTAQGPIAEGVTACGSQPANKTCVFYVHQGAVGTDCTFAAPCGNIANMKSNTRDGSPDWVLIQCGDTFTNDSINIITKSGLSAGNPQLWSNYDPGASHNPPVPNPTSCSSPPHINLDSGWANIDHFQINGAGLHDIAIAGLDLNAPKRDPASGSYSSAESHLRAGGGSIVSNLQNFLMEDVTLRNTSEGFNQGGTSAYPAGFASNLFFRRNRVFGNYGTGCCGFFMGGVSSGPTGYVFYENTIDANGWSLGCCGNSITWAPKSGVNHNIYTSGSQINGDSGSNSTPPTVIGNIISNDGSASALRVGGINKDNLWALNPRSFGVQQPSALGGNISWNVIAHNVPTGCCIQQGFSIDSRYVNESTAKSGSTINNNIWTASLNTAATALELASPTSGANANSINGNIIFNWSSSAGNGAIHNVLGGVYTANITTQGTSYADLSTSIISAQTSSSGFTDGSLTWVSDGQNYVILKVSDASQIAPLTVVYTTAGGLGGMYNATVLDGGDAVHGINSPPKYVILYGSNFSTSCGGSCSGLASGTLYYPWYNVSISCTGGGPATGCANTTSATGFQADLFSVGGNIKAINFTGSDWPLAGGEFDNSAGTQYTINDTLTAAPGATCNTHGSVGCGHGFSWNGSANVGSGLVITVNSIATNTQSSQGCNLAINNQVDTAGTNSNCSFTDPNRTLGSYYATLAGASANANFTGVVANSVLTATVQTGNAINIGDAVRWSGQTKNDYVKCDASCAGTPCNGVACTGTGSNSGGTYQLSGINATVGSQAMSSYTASQFLTLARNQSKQTWNNAYTSCALNQYINTGFGVTDPCVP